MRQVVDVAQHVLGDVRELLEAQLEDAEGDVLVLGAVVLHQRRCHEHVVQGPDETIKISRKERPCNVCLDRAFLHLTQK